MNTFSPIRLAGLAAGLACACLVSCTTALAPKKAAEYIELQPTTVYSYNDQVNPAARKSVAMGALPARARRALAEWMYHSEIESFSHIYPQYYISLANAGGDRANVWAILTNAKGEMAGVLIPRGTTPAWNLPSIGTYDVYVCSADRRKDLSRAILESLNDADMDDVRINTRRSIGLKESSLISAPAPIATAPTATKPVAAAPKAAPKPAAPAEEEEEESDNSSEESSGDDFGGF